LELPFVGGRAGSPLLLGMCFIHGHRNLTSLVRLYHARSSGIPPQSRKRLHGEVCGISGVLCEGTEATR
jgi:hypothetical protein